MDVSALETRPRPDGAADGPEQPARRAVLPVIAVAIVSLLGPLLLLLSSPHGVHASPDSFSYLGAAHSLAAGEGWTYPYGDAGAPVTLFPPVYSAVLTVPAILDVSPFDWVLWQNALFLAIFSFLVGVTVLNATRGASVPAVLAVLLVQLGTPTIVVYAHIWSETLFYPLVIVALAALGRYLATGATTWLVIAAAASGIGMLTRYAGVSLFVTACLLLVAWPAPRGWTDRLRRPGLFAAIALPLNALWLWRNQSVSGTLTGNNELVHRLTVDDVREGLETLRGWFVSAGHGRAAVIVTFALAVSSIVVLFLLIRTLASDERSTRPAIPPVVISCLAYAVAHVAFIAIANAYSTRSPPFNDRIMGSAFAPLVVAIVVAGHALWRAPGRDRIARPMLIGAGVALLVATLFGVTSRLDEHYRVERGSATFYRRLTHTLEDVISRDGALYSNRANIAWFVTGLPVVSLPRSCRGGQVLPNAMYEQELRTVARELGDAPRQVIFFQRSPRCEPFSLVGMKDALRVERIGPQGEVVVFTGPSAPAPAD